MTVTFPLGVNVERVPYVEIRDRDGSRLITVIELLSPSNKKPGADREQYLVRRRQLLRGDTHFVELDLPRGGPRLPPDEMAACDYYALVSRAEDRPRVGVWPVRLRDRLPVIPIPLSSPDPDVSLDLQQMLNVVYDRSRYAPRVYQREIRPPLHPADAEWAKQFVPTPAQ